MSVAPISAPKAVWGGQAIRGMLDGTIDNTVQLAAGTPLVRAGAPGSALKVLAEPALDGTNFITNANKLACVLVHPFDGSLYGSGVHRPTTIDWLTCITLLPGVGIEANIYYDGSGGANDTLDGLELYDTVVMKKLSSGIYVFDKASSTTNRATFTVVGYVDQPGTVYGRIIAIPDAAYRLF